MKKLMDGTMLRGNVDELRDVFRKVDGLNKDITLYLTDKDGKVKFASRAGLARVAETMTMAVAKVRT